MKLLRMNMPEQIFGVESGILLIYLRPLVLVIMILASINLIVMPRISEMEMMKKQSRDFAKKTKDLNEKIEYLIRVDQTELMKQTQFLKSSLMNGKDSYYLVNIVRKITQKFGFSVESFSINPGIVTEAGVEPKLPIKVVIVGPKEKYVELLLAIERNLPILSIDSFDIRSSGVNTELTLGMSSYYLSEAAVSKSANVTLADLTMSQEESDVLKKLSSFTPVENAPVAGIEPGETEQKRQFVKYERGDPFN